MKVITPRLRRLLSQPQGKLLSEVSAVRTLARKKNPLVVVGDVTAGLLITKGIVPSLVVYDYKKMRHALTKKAKAVIDSFKATKFVAKNPAGTITQSLESTIKKALAGVKSGKPVKLFVKGEEDLAVIPIALAAPNGTVIAYGQPKRGIVLLKTTRAVKKRVKKIYSQFTG